MSKIHNSPIGCPALVYRPKIDKWDEPYLLLDMCGEIVPVLTREGDAKFRSTVEKRYIIHDSNTED